MNIDLFGGTFFLSGQFIRLASYLVIAFFGTVAVLNNMRAGNRRRSAGIASLVLAFLVFTAVIQPELPFALLAWSVLVLEFGGAVFFGTYGWMKLRRESLAMTPALRYFAAGLLGSAILLILWVLLPSRFTSVLGLTFLIIFAGAVAWGGWLVQNRPSTLTEGVWTGGLLLVVSVMWFVLGLLTAQVYVGRGWLAL